MAFLLKVKQSLGPSLGMEDAQFISFHPQFDKLLGQQPRLEVLAEQKYKFAHEAPVYLPKTNEVSFETAYASLHSYCPCPFPSLRPKAECAGIKGDLALVLTLQRWTSSLDPCE